VENPLVLSTIGMHRIDVAVATAAAAAIGTFLVGMLANSPIAIAPMLSLNTMLVILANSVSVANATFAWELCLFAVILQGILLLLLSFTPFPSKVLRMMPESIQNSIIAGLGALLARNAFKRIGLSSLWGESKTAPVFLELLYKEPRLYCVIAALCCVVFLQMFRNGSFPAPRIAGIAVAALLLWITGLDPWPSNKIFGIPDFTQTLFRFLDPLKEGYLTMENFGVMIGPVLIAVVIAVFETSALLSSMTGLDDRRFLMLLKTKEYLHPQYLFQ